MCILAYICGSRRNALGALLLRNKPTISQFQADFWKFLQNLMLALRTVEVKTRTCSAGFLKVTHLGILDVVHTSIHLRHATEISAIHATFAAVVVISAFKRTENINSAYLLCGVSTYCNVTCGSSIGSERGRGEEQRGYVVKGLQRK